MNPQTPQLTTSPYKIQSPSMNQSATTPFVISGLKATQPGGTNSSATNTIPKTQTASTSNQQATGGASSIGSYKGQAITPGSDADVAAQIAAIDAKQSSSTQVSAASSQSNVGSSTQNNPVTGQPQTFSGLVGGLVNTSNQGSSQGQAITGNLANTSSIGNAFGQSQNQQLAQTALGNTAIGNQASAIGNQYGGQLQTIENQVAANSGAGLYSGSALSQGRAQQVAQAGSNLINQETAAENAALAGNAQQLTAQQQQANAQNQVVGNANTAQSNVQSGLNQAGGLAQNQQALTQSGLTSAAGLAQPIQAPYSNQVIDPQTGQPINGGSAGTLPASAQSFVSNLAQQVQNGQMTRPDAESELSAYGPAGLQALNTALGPNFNTNASNASASTTATGQALQTAADVANSALDTLSSSFSALPGISTGGIPATNSIANAIESALGSSALTQYKTNLDDARSQLVGVLNSSGGTPTGNEATAEAYLPDNMTVAQFNQNVGTVHNPGIVRQLIAQKVSAFTTSGNQSGSSGTDTTSSVSTPMFGNFNG